MLHVSIHKEHNHAIRYMFRSIRNIITLYATCFGPLRTIITLYATCFDP